MAQFFSLNGELPVSLVCRDNNLGNTAKNSGKRASPVMEVSKSS